MSYNGGTILGNPCQENTSSDLTAVTAVTAKIEGLVGVPMQRDYPLTPAHTMRYRAVALRAHDDHDVGELSGLKGGNDQPPPEIPFPRDNEQFRNDPQPPPEIPFPFDDEQGDNEPQPPPDVPFPRI